VSTCRVCRDHCSWFSVLSSPVLASSYSGYCSSSWWSVSLLLIDRRPPTGACDRVWSSTVAQWWTRWAHWWRTPARCGTGNSRSDRMPWTRPRGLASPRKCRTATDSGWSRACGTELLKPRWLRRGNCTSCELDELCTTIRHGTHALHKQHTYYKLVSTHRIETSAKECFRLQC